MRFVFVILALLGAPASASGQSWAPYKQAALNRVLMGAGIGAHAISISLQLNGRPVMLHAQGMAADGISAAPETRYPIASLTKAFTAAAILALVEDGTIVPFSNQPFTLDTPVNHLFAGVDAWGQLPIRQLLNMCSGLPDYTKLQFPNLNSNGPVTWNEMLSAVKTLRRMAPVCNYSNTNYFLLAQVIEILTKTQQGAFGSYHDYVRRRVFTKVQMMQTGFLSDGQAYAVPGLSGVRPHATPDWPKGAGDIVSNVIDMQKWLSAVFSGAVVSPNAIAAMTTTVGGYEMGWIAGNTQVGPTFYHSGTLPGYSAFNQVVVLPQGILGLVILSNWPTASLQPLANQIIELALNH